MMTKSQMLSGVRSEVKCVVLTAQFLLLIPLHTELRDALDELYTHKQLISDPITQAHM